MRIALVSDCYTPVINGVVTSIGVLAESLQKLGHQVEIFCPSHEKAEPEENVWRFYSVPFWLHKEERFTFFWPWRCAYRLWTAPFDVIHIHTPFNLGLAAMKTAAVRRLPRVFTHHTLWEEYVHYLPLPVEWTRGAAMRYCRGFCSWADRVVAPSAEVRDRLRAQSLAGPIDVVPTGIDTSVFRQGDPASVMSSLNWNDQVLPFLYVGRLGKEKSVDFVLKAFDRAWKKEPRLRLMVVGDGPARPDLERLVSELQNPAVHFFGFQPRQELKNFMACARGFLFASTTETQGLVLLEAQAAGVPALAIAASGTSEAVRDGYSGVLHQKGDLEGFVDSLLEMATDDQKQQQFAAQAAVWAQGFSARAMGEKMLDCYQKAASSRH